MTFTGYIRYDIDQTDKCEPSVSRLSFVVDSISECYEELSRVQSTKMTSKCVWNSSANLIVNHVDQVIYLSSPINVHLQFQ